MNFFIYNLMAAAARTIGDDEKKFYDLLKTTINGLTVVAGLVFVFSLVIAGYQYITARDNASQVAAAKNRIVVTILTFFVYVFGYALMQWLVPGGLF